MPDDEHYPIEFTLQVYVSGDDYPPDLDSLAKIIKGELDNVDYGQSKDCLVVPYRAKVSTDA